MSSPVLVDGVFHLLCCVMEAMNSTAGITVMKIIPASAWKYMLKVYLMLCDSLHGRHSSTITTIPLALFSAACRMVYLAAACETKLGVDSVQWNSKSPRNVVLCSLSITYNSYYSYPCTLE